MTLKTGKPFQYLLFFLLWGGVCLPLISAQDSTEAVTVPVEFNVNMSVMIEENNFDPETEFVDVAGSFNGWGEDLTKLHDPDNDSVYTVTVEGFTPGTTIEYKFRLNGQWDGREEFPGEGNNRTYTVKEDSNIISVWYNNELPSSGPPKARFEVSATTIHAGDLVQFQNRSYGSITGYRWEIEGGTPSTSDRIHPSVQFEQAGTFDVTLIARDTTNQRADTLVKSDLVTVKQPPSRQRQTYWWNDRVFYEIFVRSFYDSDGDGIGDFDGLRQKLDYLNDGNPQTHDDLGISAIWLMPIHPSPTYHGYDVTDYRAINPDYGSMEDFKAFLKAAHERGIKVIIDFVMNHSSDQHPWFEKSAAGHGQYWDFYRWKNSRPDYLGPWGQTVWHEQGDKYYYGVFWSGMPDLNYKTQAVKDSMFANAAYWLNEVGVDGFRLDAVIYLHEEGDTLKNTESTYQFWGDFNKRVKQADSTAMTVGEAWVPTEIAQNYFKEGRLDYGFEFDLSQAIRTAVTDGLSSPLIARMQKVTSSYRYQQYGTFLTNHDQTRIFSELEGDVGRNKAAASIYLTLPGVPYIYYGEEIGMKGSKPDPNIRRPMQWSDAMYGGFSSAQPWHDLNDNYRQYNVEDARSDSTSLWHHYDQLIELRNQHEVLRTGTYVGVPTSSDSVFAFIRKNNKEHLLVAVNLGQGPEQSLELHLADQLLPEGSLKLNNLMTAGDSAQVRVAYEASSARTTGLYLQAHEAVILDLDNPTFTSVREEQTENVKKFRLHQNHPNPFNPVTSIRFSLPRATEVRLTVYNIVGRKITTLAEGRYPKGQHTVTFKAADLSSGVYIYRLEADGVSESRKMLLVK